MQTTADRMRNLQTANERRLERARIRAMMQEDALTTVVDILEDRNPAFGGMPIIDIVRIASPKARVNHTNMNAAAIRDGINLLTPLSRAASRTIAWTINYMYTHPVAAGQHGKRRPR